ncbi:MmgE/PrpD family protein [Sneathiella litorea]|uniref:MmgE/PrpD family protein n=1 Tax=Sneathiella litorea TaxID=2606216 RepID=A0A6L8W897_9PROT|nr:MmgE/PrpD family protein [Sneathiella litorea]MZR30733.1 hypothetical protein [Sneathiella litorea]
MPYKTYTASKLATWAISLSYEDLSEEVLDRVEDCILDSIGCAIAGLNGSGSSYSRLVASKQYKNGKCPVWFTPLSLNSTGAAFSNAAAVSILDIDDGHRLAMGHPGAAVVPTALAIADEVGAGTKELYEAIVAGYEISVRLGEAEMRKSYHTGNWTVFGAAITAAKLKNLTLDQTIHALAVAAYHGPRLTDLTQSQEMGSNVKESIPWSVVAGISACELAEVGFTGSRDALDLDNRFDAKIATQKLGGEKDILGVYFKQFSTCRWTHSSIEALCMIVSEHNLSGPDIERIEVETFQQAAALNNSSDPHTLEGAQYSLPYSLAVSVTRGVEALSPMDKSCLGDKETIDLASRITISHSVEMDGYLPLRTPSKVKVITADGVYEKTVVEAWGDAGGTTKRSHLRDKFRLLAKKMVTNEQIEHIIEAVDNLRGGESTPLMNVLSKPL